VSGELRRGLALTVLFVLGLAAGIWVFVSPWALGYPATRVWTAPIWTSVWVGGILVAASGISLVAVLARSRHAALGDAAGRR